MTNIRENNYKIRQVHNIRFLLLHKYEKKGSFGSSYDRINRIYLQEDPDPGSKINEGSLKEEILHFYFTLDR